MPLRNYDVIVNGQPTVLRLNDADARRYGVYTPPPEVKKRQADNKARSPRPARKTSRSTGK